MATDRVASTSPQVTARLPIVSDACSSPPGTAY